MPKKMGIQAFTTAGDIRRIVGNAALEKSMELNLQRLFVDMSKAVLSSPDFKEILSSVQAGNKLVFKVTVQEKVNG